MTSLRLVWNQRHVKQPEAPAKKTRNYFRDSPVKPPDPMIGLTINGRYPIADVLGKGGVGVVYSAIDNESDKEVAVKTKFRCLNKTEQDQKQLVEMANRLKGIKHKNIVEILDADISENEAYVVMEKLNGQDMQQFLDEKHRLSWEDAKKIILQVCDGLMALHENGIAHGNIKPSNLFMTEDGTVKILDFDTSKCVLMEEETDERKVQATHRYTPEYTSPEQAAGKDYDHRADVYNVGILFYRMVSGKLPLKGDWPMDTLIKQIDIIPWPPGIKNPNIEITREQEDLIMKALEKNPKNRFQTMAEMKEAIERL